MSPGKRDNIWITEGDGKMIDGSINFEQIQDLQEKAIHLQFIHWITQEVPTFQFWLLLILLIVPWFIWWKLVDRKRLLGILVLGLLTMNIVTVLDEVGCQLNLWEYLIDIEPYFPRLIPLNFTILPVVYMLIYQYFPKWKPFIATNIVVATLFAFVGETALVVLKIYILMGWKHIYSFPIYILLAIGLKALTDVIIKAHRG
jgi:hypothetical protein